MLPLFAHSRHIAFPPVFVYSFGAIFGKITVIEPSKISRSIRLSPYQIVVFRYHFGVSSPVLPGVVPPLNLTAAYQPEEKTVKKNRCCMVCWLPCSSGSCCGYSVKISKRQVHFLSAIILSAICSKVASKSKPIKSG